VSHSHHISTANENLRAEPGERLARPFVRFAQLSCSGGLVLLAMTVLAMVWANSRYAPVYDEVFHTTYFEIIVEGEHKDVSHADDHAAVADDEAHIQGSIASAGEGSLGGLSLANQADHHPEPAEDDHASDHHGPTAPEGSYLFLGHGLTHWINDLLMAVFFLVVGLEIKREIVAGELASPKKAALPIFAALGGMIAPALIFAGVNWGDPAAMPGWGVPMATDIAFAMGVMAMMGNKIPTSLKVFLLSLAIVDDLGALVVIAVFYTADPKLAYLAYAFGIIGILMTMNILKVRWVIPYLLLGLPLWYLVYMSGVHATIAGVMLAMTIPAHSRVDPVQFSYSTRRALEIFENAEDGSDIKRNAVRQAAVYAMIKNAKFVLPPLHRMETTLHPWAAFLIIPVFALANAGIPLHGGLGEAVSGKVAMGIVAGLVIGKPLGITIASFIAVKIGIAALPTGVTWRHIIGAGMLGGIGFTMAIFIANLAYKTDPSNLEHAKIAILMASCLSAMLGALMLATCKSAPDPEPELIGPEVGGYYAAGDQDH
jgi:NhaA family Na+:H+ antiporter